jgi:hypothetical protein
LNVGRKQVYKGLKRYRIFRIQCAQID